MPQAWPPRRAIGRSRRVPDSRVWYPYTQMLGLPAPVEIVCGDGAWLIARDGSRYLDAISSWWVTLHGHAEPRIARAIAAQAAQLEQVILSGLRIRWRRSSR